MRLRIQPILRDRQSKANLEKLSPAYDAGDTVEWTSRLILNLLRQRSRDSSRHLFGKFPILSRVFHFWGLAQTQICINWNSYSGWLWED